ncbi:MAG TPA: hypothetical protein VFE62_23020 [Gemmataceae bacterium]|nr:hypothetical protein [Gemmataceae bacterium]
MWTCPKCAEQNEDNFQICWKCASDESEMETRVTAEPPPIVPRQMREPKLRSGASIIVRILIAFIVGGIFGGAVFQAVYRTTDPVIVGTWALISGLCLAGVIGIYFWVIFPYVPGTEREVTETPEG